MSKISHLDDYKMGKLKGKCTDFPNKERLNTSDENYRRGYKVGKKAGAKDTLDKAFSDSVSDLKALIAQYRQTKDIKVYDAIIDKYQDFLLTNGRLSDSSNIKNMIAEYRKTKDSGLFKSIVKAYTKVKDADDDDDFVLFEDKDGDTKLAKKYAKNNLESAREFLEDNPDMKVVGEDEDGGVLVTDKDDDDDATKEDVVEQKELKMK